MKSIIQEASSIAKAVEEGWIKAQKPQQFSVKILEEAEKNFLGLTKKSAKVAIFFDEPQLKAPGEKMQTTKTAPITSKVSRPIKNHSSTPQHTTAKHENVRYTQLRQNNNETPPYTHNQEAAQSSSLRDNKKKFEPLWNQGIVDRTKQWMEEALKNSQQSDVSFTIEPQKFHLRIMLSRPLLSDQAKEKQLLASFSILILETLKRTFKMSLRGHKIVLTHQPA